jgi:transcriptional regulator with XRE-family HTH domain
MNLNSMSGLVSRLSQSKNARAQFVSSQLDKFIAFQIRALRDQEGMSQTELAEALQTSQTAVHRFESPNKGRPTITTLKKIAAVFDVGLEVRFVPFSKLARYVSGTPYVEQGLSTGSFYVTPFAKDTITASLQPIENEGGQAEPQPFMAESARKPPQREEFADAGTGVGGI